jgi:hypothetical protein
MIQWIGVSVFEKKLRKIVGFFFPAMNKISRCPVLVLSPTQPLSET